MEGFSISNDLLTDLMLEILLLLPVKSLLRFKCICKSWFTLINSIQFMNMRNSKKESILTINPVTLYSSIISKNEESFSVDDDLNVYSSHIGLQPLQPTKLLACDGIVLETNYYLSPYVLHNSATKQTVVLPEPSFPDDPCYKTWFTDLGFGYDLKHQNYKIVRIRTFSSDVKTYEDNWFYDVKVYMLGANSWNKVTDKGNFNSQDIGKISGGGFYFNGAIHWHGFRLLSGAYRCTIVSFHLGDEEFQAIEVPEPAWTRIHDKQFLVWNGCLAVSAIHPSCTSLDIIVMKDYGVKESWMKLFSIGPGVFSNVRPLTVWKNNEFLFQVRDDNVYTGYFHLVSFDLDKQEFKKVGIRGGEHQTAFVHKENLVSIQWRREPVT